jgi:hypothetical protein
LSYKEKINLQEDLKRCQPTSPLGKKIGFDFVAPYSDLTEYKGLGQAKKKNGSKKEKGKPAENAGLPVWWAILNQKRIFFEQSLTK